MNIPSYPPNFNPSNYKVIAAQFRPKCIEKKTFAADRYETFASILSRIQLYNQSHPDWILINFETQRHPSNASGFSTRYYVPGEASTYYVQTVRAWYLAPYSEEELRKKKSNKSTDRKRPISTPYSNLEDASAPPLPSSSSRPQAVVNGTRAPQDVFEYPDNSPPAYMEIIQASDFPEEEIRTLRDIPSVPQGVIDDTEEDTEKTAESV